MSLIQPIPSNSRFQDLTGRKFSKVFVAGYAGKQYRWHAICSCGASFIACGYSLRHNKTTSCGCKHGMTLRELLLRYRHICSTSGCWEWTYNGSTNDGFGYGRLEFRRQRLMVHRASYELFVGKIPDGMCCCHKCDNARCFRPDHLFLGTKGDNNRDRTAKKRTSLGERHGRAKLSELDVLEIRRLCNDGHRYIDVASMFNVCKHTVALISQRKTWKHLH